MAYICSPYRADTPEELEENLNNVRRYFRFALSQGYAPIATHFAVCSVLDDNDPAEREQGISLDVRYLTFCDELWVFGNRISAGMAMNLLRARIGGFLTTQTGWKENCKANKRFCWSDLPACLPMHAYGLYLTPFDTAAPIVATVNRIQDANELLAPANVPAVMEFDMPDGTRLQKHCAVNFQTGDIYGVIAPADASDACVIIPFTDKILPCRPGPTPSLKQ